ncbi:ATP-dependent DNA ligase [Dactylosporangium sp. AC04546]|uniref:ATP-dependent DNA ligase n=1 Tax=Dactylosporangium sp. AC04546 TaxID=2862460 RepID=UPI002E7AB692|nr:ATP-dependent DNA ligase [Dactylosporangium sp. AC04546]WVK89564.1 ATP-dependent DNA ligase [Dactylosporangium sp. AC04546]
MTGSSSSGIRIAAARVFPALQGRITAGRRLLREARDRPGHFVAFDVLRDGLSDLVDRPLLERRARLEELLASAPPQLQLCPQTTDTAEARAWMADWAGAGVEGIVAKDPAGRYTPGRAGWVKLKTRNTVEAIVGGVTGTLSAPGTLLLGRLDADGRLRYVGLTHPVPTDVAAELGRALTRYVAQQRRQPDQHPWPQPLPPTWAGQLGGTRPIPYVPVRPEVVVEVEVDLAFGTEARRWRHRTKLVRVRADLSPYDVARAAAF